MERSSVALPSTVIVPALGRRKPRRQERSVVLPAPFGPIRPRVSPRGTSRDTPSSARVRRPKRPYVFDTSVTVIIEDRRIPKGFFDPGRETVDVRREASEHQIPLPSSVSRLPAEALSGIHARFWRFFTARHD